MGTYTTNYNLFLPTIGEQGWGDLVNGNFTTIDTAMKGLDGRVGTLETETDTVEERVTVCENTLSNLTFDLTSESGVVGAFYFSNSITLLSGVTTSTKTYIENPIYNTVTIQLSVSSSASNWAGDGDVTLNGITILSVSNVYNTTVTKTYDATLKDGDVIVSRIGGNGNIVSGSVKLISSGYLCK